MIDPSGFWSVDLGIIKVGNHGTSNGFVTRALLRSQVARIVVGTWIMANFGPYGAAAYSAFLTKAAGGSWEDTIKSGATAWLSANVAQKIGDSQTFGGHDSSLLIASSSQAYAQATAKAIAHGLSQGATAKPISSSISASSTASARNRLTSRRQRNRSSSRARKGASKSGGRGGAVSSMGIL